MEIKSRQKHLCFVAHKFQRNDGQGRVNYELVHAALVAGYRVTLLASDCARDIADHPSAEFVMMGSAKAPTELLRNLIFANQSAAYLKRHRKQFDLVQANGFVTWEVCDVVAAHFVHTTWGQSTYYPFTGLAPYSLYQRLYTTLNSRWEKRAFLGAKRVVAVSRMIGEELIELGVLPDHVRVIPNGVDAEQFHPGLADRQAFGLPEGKIIALFVGDIRTPRKNLDTVLKALQRVPGLSLAVAGARSGSPYPAMAESLGIQNRVFFLDKVSNIELLMRSVDLFVFPSRYEAYGLVLLEAMASGLPSITSSNVGAAEFMRDAGRSFDDPNDVETLASLLHSFVDEPEARREMGAKGRELALAMQWSSMAEAYLELYRELLA